MTGKIYIHDWSPSVVSRSSIFTASLDRPWTSTFQQQVTIRQHNMLPYTTIWNNVAAQGHSREVCRSSTCTNYLTPFQCFQGASPREILTDFAKSTLHMHTSNSPFWQSYFRVMIEQTYQPKMRRSPMPNHRLKARETKQFETRQIGPRCQHTISLQVIYHTCSWSMTNAVNPAYPIQTQLWYGPMIQEKGEAEWNISLLLVRFIICCCITLLSVGMKVMTVFV